MFGRALDYNILRLLLGPNAMKADPIADPELDAEQAQAALRKFNKRLGNTIPFESRLRHFEV